MIQVRNNVFETNSSSVHSICLCSKDVYERWAESRSEIKEDSYLWDTYSENLVPISEILSDIPMTFKEAKEINFSCLPNHYYTTEGFDNYTNDYWYEAYYTEAISPSGDEMVAFGYFGHD